MAERICIDDEEIARELHDLNQTNEYMLKIASKLASKRLLWIIRWRTVRIRPIFITGYFSSLFFGLYDLVKDRDENDLAFLCIKGIEASLQNSVFEMGRWWWEKIDENISYAIKNNHPTHIQEIANLFYEHQPLAYYGRAQLQFEEIQEIRHSYRVNDFVPYYLERIIKTIIDGAIDPRPLAQILLFLLLTAKLSVLREETDRVAVEALALFSKSIIKMENTLWPDKEYTDPYNVTYSCIPEFAQTAEFMVRQVYKSGFTKIDDWRGSFVTSHSVISCIRPLGSFLFAKEWLNLFYPLLSAARYIAEVEILAEGKLQKSTTYSINSSDTIARMFREWFESCPNYPNERGEWRNNADLIVKTICLSASTIRNSDQQAFLTYRRSLEETFEGTYIWHNISTCLQ